MTFDAAGPESQRLDCALLTDGEEFAGAGSFRYDLVDGGVRWSPGMYRIRGLPAGGDLTHDQAAAVDPRDRERVLAVVAAALAGDAAVLELTYRIVRPDGAVRWLDTRSRIDRDASGKAVALLGGSIDVTARRRCEQRLEEHAAATRRRERMLRGVIDNNKALIYVKDLDGRYLLYNSRFADAFSLADRAAAEGVAPSEILVGRDDHWLDPVLCPSWRENDLLAREGAHRVEEFGEHPERGRLSYDSIKFPLVDDDGTAYATCGMSLDTTLSTREREALTTAARYVAVSRDMVCTAGFDGVLRQLNAAWTATLGWSEEELRSRPFVDFVHPEDRERTVRETAGLAAGGETVDFVNRYATKSGGWVWLDWRAMAVLEDGLIYASARDISQRKATERALEETERQAGQVLEKALDGFISLDGGGLVTAWNAQASAIFGWTREEIIGRDLADFLIPEAHREAHRRGIRRFVATGEERMLGRRLELTVLHRDGYEFLIEMAISATETTGGYSFNAFLRDITERRRTEEELGLARDQALAASRMKSMFVANMSHEIRTPMNGVIGMTELLLETPLDDVQRDYAQTISSSGEALLTLIDDILDLSKVEAGKLELDPTDFDLRETIERACGMLAARSHAKGVELAVVIDPGVPVLMRGDAARLRQVITNFLSNAIKFTADGQVVVRVSAGPEMDGMVAVRVAVTDTGIGISHQALKHLFQPFQQADSSTTRKYGGTGLGLAISRQLIRLMGGQIGVESEPGRGSTFWFELPLGLALALANPSAEPGEPGRDVAGLRVLVAGDGAGDHRMLERQLRSWRMSCQATASAAGAVELLSAARTAGIPFALAIIDLPEPDDGCRFAAAIRADPRLDGTRLILLAPGRAPADAPSEAALDSRLTKPVDPSRLYEEIQGVIAGGAVAGEVATRGAAEVDDRGGAAEARPLVLVAEDTPVNQMVAARMLENRGYRSHIAENGRRALEALAREPYAAVLMDCQMPELDGYETTRQIRRREHGTGQRIPIIAMTANSMQGERERCLAAGMDDYLTKPLRKLVLKDTLARWIPRPQADLPGDGGQPAAMPAAEPPTASAPSCSTRRW